MNAIYVSYDGALDPLGRSQVVPYLEGLSARGWSFDLVTFEKDERWRDEKSRREMEERLAAAQIAWSPLRYHKRPPVLSTAFGNTSTADFTVKKRMTSSSMRRLRSNSLTTSGVARYFQ